MRVLSVREMHTSAEQSQPMRTSGAVKQGLLTPFPFAAEEEATVAAAVLDAEADADAFALAFAAFA